MNGALFGKPEEFIYYPNIFPGMADTSGIFIMRYKDFISENAGAKDTWGINYFMIEGETGYIYIDEPNGLKNVRIVTKTSDETFNLQPDPDRWYYEVQELVRLMLSEERSTLDGMLDVSVETVSVIEKARREAGIIFPSD